ncbi:hypothetical protein [Actinomycetospora flava]|uniref:Uncharacterized protein n=1 Tax=Actinomycetospora flava TaxID=3129232 RepID=A0ABU8M6S3_9PSEU
MQSVLITYYADQACTQPDPAGRFFRGLKNAEKADSSGIVAEAFVRKMARWGNATIRVVALDRHGDALGEAPANQDWWGLPTGVRSFSVEGQRDNAGVQIAVDLLQLAR